MTIASLFPIVYVCVYDCKKHKVDFKEILLCWVLLPLAFLRKFIRVTDYIYKYYICVLSVLQNKINALIQIENEHMPNIWFNSFVNRRHG